MSFIDNILTDLGLKEALGEQSFKMTVIGDSAIYIECVKSIKSYSKTEIILRLKNGGVIIKGEEMFIKKYFEGDMAVCGKIKSIERV